MTTKIFNAQGQPNNWIDTKNWVGGVVPGSADVALLNGVGSKEFTGPISVGTVMLLGASNVAFDGTVNTSGEGFCRGIMVCNGGTMTFNAGSTLNDLAGSLNIGVHAVGSFIANGMAGRATVINTADALVGQYAQGVGTVTIDDRNLECQRDGVDRWRRGRVPLMSGTVARSISAEILPSQSAKPLSEMSLSRLAVPSM